MHNRDAIYVTSETSRLRKVLVHSPDSGLGKVVPSKAQDWLFEDIVHLDTIRRHEYDYYIKLLLYFLDEEKIRGRLAEIDAPGHQRNFFKPDHPSFYHSQHVIELQVLLADILADTSIKSQLVASVCAIEACSYDVQRELMGYPPAVLARVFFSGTPDEREMIFPPIPNFIFTRDIGIVINDHILLNKPMKEARKREALIAKYIFYHHPFFAAHHDKVIELTDTQHHFLLPNDADVERVTLEGGDVMVVSPSHVLIGVSERTTREAAAQAVRRLFEKDVVQKATIVKIPHKRDYMHIDTVFTQVKRNVWVMLGDFSTQRIAGSQSDAVHRALRIQPHRADGLEILQFEKGDLSKPRHFQSLEALLTDISVRDLGCAPEEVRIIMSGNNEFPYDAREQWTDSCNVLAIQEGVVLGYDRNDKTTEAFRAVGFDVVNVSDLLADLESGKVNAVDLTDTLVLMPSAELSRARGGFHCMSMPLLRD
ncbi:arginine deiminase family protein [Parapedobacter sp. 10938]|uniref:arginine deiminase family protein n=1 Tax=Parapedobacter flavus TaxID=3110225 RepID=UPI002DBB8044|nr:arginine deiminase family protein [Parapedobacter sp. 10938]MEC3879920.1 arginine deiminase family protein [Parapedobacter sp. 10938]